MNIKEFKWVIGPPPIHEHYNPETGNKELCGRVVCPHGFVGVSIKPTAQE